MARKIVEIGTKLIEKYEVIGTNTICYAAWERDLSSILETPYSTIRHHKNLRYGKVGSDDASRGEEAYALIMEAFPEAIDGTWDETMKEVITYGE